MSDLPGPLGELLLPTGVWNSVAYCRGLKQHSELPGSEAAPYAAGSGTAPNLMLPRVTVGKGEVSANAWSG